MKLVYRAATGSPLHCIAFHGITVLDEPRQQGLFLVFDLATGGTVKEYLERFGNTLQWDDLIDLFTGIATVLTEIHKRGISHGLAFIYILAADIPQRPPRREHSYLQIVSESVSDGGKSMGVVSYRFWTRADPSRLSTGPQSHRNIKSKRGRPSITRYLRLRLSHLRS